jgi:two-component system phosphate regulon sensor histidine kinase PhoR
MSDRRGRVLVVDDELGMREGCRRILAPGGHDVTTTETGEQALGLFRPGAFDLALIDLKMPGISGIELLSRLRQADPDLLCIVITAYASLDTAVQATKTGAYDYLAKPFTPDELTAAVDKALEVQWLTREAARLRAEAERSLLLVANEQSRTRTIIQGMADGVLVTNREGKLVLYNQAALRLLGIKERPALGDPPSSTLFPAELLRWMEEARAGSEAVMVARDLPGGPPHLSANVAVIRDETGEALGAVAVLRDITEMKSLEHARREFVFMVAHELRAPLGAVAQYLDVILNGFTAGQPERERQMLSRCRERTESLSQLVRDLLEFSTATRARSFAPVDLGPVARGTVEFLAPTAQARKIAMSLEVAESLPLVEADREEMERLATNLVSNAIKYNRDGGSVTVRATATDGYVVLEVSDTGIGIPPEARSRLGEAFFRVKGAHTSHITGTGLGLSIVKQIIEAHQGHLEIESEEGSGSMFRVLLPRGGVER